MKEKTPEELVNDIRDACAALGWDISMNDTNSAIDGLIIGRSEYVADVVSQLDDADDYSIYESGNVDVGLQ